MRTVALALVVAAAAGAHTPQGAVKRFIEPRSAKDACAQLAPAYRKRLEETYGPCVPGIKKNPRATNLVISHVVVHGKHATLEADYRVPGSTVYESYSLVKHHHIWLSTGAR